MKGSLELSLKRGHEDVISIGSSRNHSNARKQFASPHCTGVPGKFNGFSSACGPFPSLFFSLFLCRFCHLIRNIFSFSGQLGGFGWLG